MMDEQLIDEVAQHGVIYNRQKYYLNGTANSTNKYETKDEAWQTIAIKLRSDVETCKKRWKYLRERYVSQRKQGDPPVYEHLSRPYLEKMKFLDQHIQPRKSYRNVPSFLTSPHSANSSNYSEYNMDSKSNGSMKSINHFSGNNNPHAYHQQDQQHAMNALSSAAVAASAMDVTNGQVKIEADQVFRDFAAAVASQQLQQISQSQMHHHQAAAVAAAMADSSQNYQEHFRDGAAGLAGTNGNDAHNGISMGSTITSSSSSMKSPLSSPLPNPNTGGHSSSAPLQSVAHSSSSVANNQISGQNFNESHGDDLDSSTNSNFHMKKPRVQLNGHNGNGNNNHHHNTTATNGVNGSGSNFADDSDEDSDNSTNILHAQTILNEHPDNHFNSMASTSSAASLQQRNVNGGAGTVGQQHQQNSSSSSCMFPSNADFLFQLYQQQTTTQQQHLNKFSVPHTNPPIQRCSEHLLGELVTTELLKMTKERRKHAQKRILEILFFED